MRLKRREDIRRELRPGRGHDWEHDRYFFRNSAESFPGHACICRDDFGGVRISEPAAADGSGEVHSVVAVFVFGDWDWDWLGDVSVFAVRRAINRAHA